METNISTQSQKKLKKSFPFNILLDSCPETNWNSLFVGDDRLKYFDLLTTTLCADANNKLIPQKLAFNAPSLGRSISIPGYRVVKNLNMRFMAEG